MSTETVVRADTYGNISKPGRSGLMGLPLSVTIVGFVVILLMVAMLAKGWMLAGFGLLLFYAVSSLLVMVTKKDGRSIYGRLMLKFMQRRKERANKHVYIAGPAGKIADGTCRLPGMMAPSELSEHSDPFGNRFGLIRAVSRTAKNYSVVIETHPDGDELVDQSRVSQMVAHWGAWLADRGTDEGIRGASVTVESAPDSGLRLRRLMQSQADDSASDFASEVAAAIPQEYEGGAPTITTRITVTFDGRAVDGSGKDRGVEEMAQEIGNRLSVLTSSLKDTGAGTAVRMCTAQEIIDFTRAAYDPTTASQIEEAQAEGGTGLRWEDAGPAFALDAFDHYRHDRAFSKSWTMYEGPRGVFHASALRRILEPTPDVLRKRVTLLYRPIPAAQATDLVERDINDSQWAASQKQRPSARALQRRAAALKSAQEEAEGAGLVRFGIVVTVSAADPARFKQLDKQIPAHFNQARLRVRPALGNQAVTFQAGLPLGLVLPDQMIIPDQVRDWM